MSRLVTNSEMETYKECKRRWWLSYVRRLKHRTDPDSGQAARVGTIYHSVMEEYYHSDLSTEARARALALADPPITATADDLKEYSLARTMAEGYFDWLDETGADADLEFESVEDRLTTASPVQGVELLGKADLLATRTRSGERMVVDHKTTSSFARSLSDIHLLRQPKLYSLMRRILLPDSPLHGVLWNMARSVKRGPRSNPPFYMRYELAMTDMELRRYWRELEAVIIDMMRDEARLAEVNPIDRSVVAYPTPSKDCSWKCPFYVVCGYFDDPKFDVESIIDSSYEVYDPLERYEFEEGTEE